MKKKIFKLGVLLPAIALLLAFSACKDDKNDNNNFIFVSGLPVEKSALATMKTYITDVVTHFKGRIYSWDVLNEAFPDGVSASADWKTAMRKAGDSQGPNPWYVAIGSDFVYEGFLAARLADPDAKLYYNDYNLDQKGKATMVCNMVRDVNKQYLEGEDKPEGEDLDRLLIEGIGMQSHHNTSVSANSIKASLELFKPLGVKISISELDVLAQSWNEYSNKTPVTAQGLQTQATLYGSYRTLFLQYADIIERITLWGLTDDKSWRSRGQPLLFNSSVAKEAYYKFSGETGSGGTIANVKELKNCFSGISMIGNIFNPGDVSGGLVTTAGLTRHFNILTAENNMKPQYIAPSKGSYNFTQADTMVNAAIESNFKVVGHTLLWHSQNASWMNNL